MASHADQERTGENDYRLAVLRGLGYEVDAPANGAQADGPGNDVWQSVTSGGGF